LARALVQVRAHCQRMLHLKGSSFEDLGKTLDGTGSAGEATGRRLAACFLSAPSL